MIAVKALREFYFFHRLLESWVEMEDKKENKPEVESFPGNPEELNQSLNQKSPDNMIIFPITNQEKIPEALEVLRANFAIRTIPDWVFNIQELPESNWDIFDKRTPTTERQDDVEMKDYQTNDQPNQQ